MKCRIMGALALVAGVTLPCRGRADVTSQIYDDVKGVIVDLVTADVARSVVPQIVCRAGHVIETKRTGDPSVIPIDHVRYRFIALDHFPRTLQALYSRQFGGLKSAMLAEVADLAAYRLLVALRDQTRFQIAEVGGRLSSDQVHAAVSGQLEASRARPVLDADEIDRLGVLKTGGQVEPPEFAATYGAPPDITSCLTPVARRFDEGTFGAPRATPLEQRCAAPDGEHLACDLALGLRSMLIGQPGAAARHVTRAMSRVVAGVVAARLAFDRAEILEPRLAVMIASLADGPAPANLLRSLAEEIAPLTATYDKLSDRDVQIALATQKALESLIALEQPFRRLLAEWRAVASGDARLDVASFVDRILATRGALYALCKQAASIGVCREIGGVAQVLAPGRVMWPLLQATSRGDVRTVAQAVLGSIFSAKQEDGCEDASTDECQRAVFPRFAMALSLYVIDTVDGGTTAEAARAAFRAAAVDVIRSVRPLGYTRSWVHNIPHPDFALRFSWNGGHVSDKGSSFRYVASMPFIVFRPPLWYSERAYAAVHLSIFDPLAPLSELALRPNNVDFRDDAEVAWNLISPRLDVVVGMPSLSSHLTLGIGASLRLAVPYDITPGEVTRSYTYRPLWDDGASLSRSIELGFAIKYML